MKPFQLGIQGFYKNQSSPYKKDSFDHKEWERGYNKAYFDNLERVKNGEAKKANAA